MANQVNAVMATVDDLDIRAAHQRVIRYVEASAQASDRYAQLQIRDRNYRDHEQWTAAQVAELEGRGQPATVMNLISQKIDTLCGLERQQRRDVVAKPRRISQSAKADAATHSIRYTLLDQDFDSIASDLFDQLCVEGGAVGVILSIKPYLEGTNPVVNITPLTWDRTIIDPYARSRDCSRDARYIGHLNWVDEDVVLDAFPDKKQYIGIQSATGSIFARKYDDNPFRLWYDSTRKRLAVYEIWERHNNKIYQAIFTYSGMLHYAESPFYDENNTQIWPIELNSAYRDYNGDLYGVVRGFIDAQNEVNHKHSKATHLMSCRQFFVDEARAGATVEDIQDMLAQPDGGLNIVDLNAVEILNTTPLVQEQVQMLNVARDYILNTGARTPLAGTVPSQSGRAALIEQSAGMTELGTIFDVHNAWKNRVYRKIWCIQKQFWKATDWLAILGSDEVKSIGINEPITEGQQLIEDKLKSGQPITPEDEQQAAQLTNVVSYRNRLADLDVNFELESSIDAPGLQNEQFQVLAQLMTASQNITPQRLKLLIHASILKNKSDLLEMLETEEKEQAGQQQQIPQEVQQQIEQLKQQADTNKTALMIEQMRQDSDLQIKEMENQNKLMIQSLQDESKKQSDELKAMLELYLKGGMAAQPNLTGVS